VVPDEGEARLAPTGVELPSVYVAADQSSRSQQRLSLWLRRVQLVTLVAAAALGAVAVRTGSVEWGPLLAGVAFVVAGLLEATILTVQPERGWYGGRAVAESVKTLAWSYAVAGEPFVLPQKSEDEADALLLQRVTQILDEFREIAVLPVAGRTREITGWMRALRARPLTDRKESYQRDRIEDQRVWYANRARWNRRRSVWWSLVMLAIQSLGLGGALLKGVGIIDFDALGILAAAAASVLAWLQLKQHATLAQSYSHAAHELSTIEALIGAVRSEAEWGRFVNDAENAISREHTAWRARRS
jgi:SMODS and SLOG-associating 2TM effector domain 3/SMODS and SLOG-associating 2TM effector domain 1